MKRTFQIVFVIVAVVLLTLLIIASRPTPANAHSVPCTHTSKQVGAHGKTVRVRSFNLYAGNGLHDHFHVQEWRPVRGGVLPHTDTIRCGQWSRNDSSHVWHWHSGMSRESLYRHPLHPTTV